MLKSKLPIFISVILVSCSSQNIQDSGYKIKSLETPLPLSSSSPLDKNLPLPNPPQSSQISINSIKNLKSDEKIEFNKDYLNYPKSLDSIAKGLISVIYKNSYKIRTIKKSTEMSSNDKNITDEINIKLNGYKIKSTTSLLPENADLVNLKKVQMDLSDKFKIDFPELSSIHFYEFPEDSDTIKISEELRKLPYVETAYPTPIGTTSSTPAPNFISRQSIYDIHKNVPSPSNDPFFASLSENVYWSWFNHHKIFQAWDIYRQNFGNVSDISNVAQSDLPIIAVVDNGFYKGADADSPTYFTGSHYGVNGAFIDTNTSQHTQYNINNPTLSDSHGTSMANIIASPKNNGVAFCVVIPNARIYPVKIDLGYDSINDKYYLSTASMAAGIINAGSMNGWWGNPNVDVINASLEISNPSRPISYDSVVNSAIQYAIGQGKSVVISAGNDKTNLDTYTSPSDYGAVIVGGSSSYDGKIWNSSTTEGSNYGQSVTLASQGGEIYAPTWRVSTNSLNLTNLNNGTSPAAAEVSGVLGMLKKLAVKKGVSYTPQELRDVIAYSATLGVSSLPSNSQPSNYPPPALNTKKFLGRGLANTNDNINLYAEMRDMNAWSALSVVNNSNYPNLVRIFNSDDFTWATTNGDWNARYASENYFDESFWGFSNPLSSGTTLNFFTSNNAGGNGSIGYQVYNYGKFNVGRNYGVLTRYDTSTGSMTPYYNTVGPSTSGWFGGMSWLY